MDISKLNNYTKDLNIENEGSLNDKKNIKLEYIDDENNNYVLNYNNIKYNDNKYLSNISV